MFLCIILYQIKKGTTESLSQKESTSLSFLYRYNE